MAEKKAIPIRIDYSRPFTNAYGTFHVFDIQFDDGTVGEFSTTKKDNQTKFKVGEEVVYTSEEKTDKQGNVVIKIDKPKQDSRPSGRGGTGQNSKAIDQVIVASVCADCAGRMIIFMEQQEHIEDDLVGLNTLANKFYNHIIEKSTGNKQTLINYQSRLKEIVDNLWQFPKLNVTTSDKVLDLLDKRVAWLQEKMKE